MNKKRVVGLFIFSLFAISLFTGLASAQNPVIDPIVEIVTFQEDIGENVTKWLFIILLSLLVWSAVEVSGLVKNNGVRWLISILVAFLAVSYFTTEEITSLLLGYSALGLTLLFLVPLGILFFFSVRVIMHGGPKGVIAQYFMWIIYFVFLIYRFVADVVLGDLPYDSATTWIFLGIIILTAIMVFGNRAIRKKLGKEFLEAEIEEAESTIKRATAVERARAEATKTD